MSRCTISYESLAKSMGSFVASAIIPYSAPVVDLESKPFKDPVSPVASDSDSRTGPIDASSGLGPTKTVRPQPTLPPSTLALIADWAATPSVLSPPSSPLSPLISPSPSPVRFGPSYRRPRTLPSSSAGPPRKRCRVSPTQALLAPVLEEENDGVNEGVNNEDIEDEDVEIELDDDAELIFPYEVEDDKTPPPGGVSSNSEPPNAEPPNAESSDSVSSDSESEEKEADVAPEDTFGTITQRPYAVRDFPRGVFEAGEPSSAHDSSYVGGLAPQALRCDL
ncbi:hypothetical protein Tco_1228775 [Tanacetum coccineum]